MADLLELFQDLFEKELSTSSIPHRRQQKSGRELLRPGGHHPDPSRDRRQ